MCRDKERVWRTCEVRRNISCAALRCAVFLYLKPASRRARNAIGARSAQFVAKYSVEAFELETRVELFPRFRMEFPRIRIGCKNHSRCSVAANLEGSGALFVPPSLSRLECTEIFLRPALIFYKCGDTFALVRFLFRSSF